MIRYLLAFAASFALMACGGSTGEDLTDRYGFRAQAFAYQNAMPSVAGLGSSACNLPLIVIFAIRSDSGAFPQGLKAGEVSLKRAGQVAWRGPVSALESGIGNKWTTETDWLASIGSADGNAPPGTKNERILSGVARGCMPQSLRAGDAVEASILVNAGGEEAAVSVLVSIGSVS